MYILPIFNSSLLKNCVAYDFLTAHCAKASEEKATCLFCRGEHPASYKGCEYYKQEYNKKFDQTL